MSNQLYSITVQHTILIHKDTEEYTVSSTINMMQYDTADDTYTHTAQTTWQDCHTLTLQHSFSVAGRLLS